MSCPGRVKARVASVRPRGDGSYAITLARGDGELYWLRAGEALRLGDLVEVEPEASRTRVLDGDRSHAELTVLDGGALRVLESAFARRVVPEPWVRRAGSVMRRPLYAYQAEGAGWIASRIAAGRGAILADEPGLGKTIQTLAALVAAKKVPFVVVCPSSAKGNWVSEARHVGEKLRLESVDGRHGRLSRAHGYVLNYELLRDREAQLSQLGVRCLVLDEAHNVKEPAPAPTHRAAVATRLAFRMGSSVQLTGTPLLNRPHELWRMLHIADRRAWPEYAAFRARYCTEPEQDERFTGTSVVTEHGGVYRLEELRTLSDRAILRRLKSDLLSRLPPKQRRTVRVPLEPADRAHYDAAERNVVAWLKAVRADERAATGSKNEALVRLTMLRRIAAVGKLRRALPRYLRQWFDREAEPLVIFAYHQDVVAGVHAICQGLGVRRSGITGKTPSAERVAEVDRFTMGQADVFIAPIKSAGVAINLQVARHALFVERMWTPSLMNQAEDRLHRIGQSRQVVITNLDAERTVDEYVAEVLEAKQRLIDRVVDDVERATASRETSETLEAVMERMARAL